MATNYYTNYQDEIYNKDKVTIETTNSETKICQTEETSSNSLNNSIQLKAKNEHIS